MMYSKEAIAYALATWLSKLKLVVEWLRFDHKTRLVFEFFFFVLLFGNRASKLSISSELRKTTKMKYQTNFVANFYDNTACSSVTAFEFVNNVGKSKRCAMYIF